MAEARRAERVFLTGGTGFIGRALVRALRDRGWEVDALVRDPGSGPARELDALGARLVRGDVTDAASLDRPMAAATLVIHNAGLYEYGLTRAQRARMQAVNVDGTRNVLRAARTRGIPRSVHVSSVVALGDSNGATRDESYVRTRAPATFYERTKAEAHQVALDLRREGLPLMTVLPAAVIGPDDHSAYGHFLRMWVNGVMPPIAWSPRAIATPVYVDDLAEGVALVAERGRPGEDYVLGGEAETMRAILRRWAREPGGLAPWVFLPAWLAVPAFAPAAPLLRRLGLPAFISAETVAGAALDYDYSSAKARRELGWSPRDADELWRLTFEAERARRERLRERPLVERLRVP
jgi:nucleoside-diphosphate-sugar epimerase